MRGLEINLAAEPYRNDMPFAVLLVLLGAVAFGLTGWGSYSYFTASAQRAALEAELAGHSSRMADMKKEADQITAELGVFDEPLLASQAAFVDGILDQRNFSWTSLFNVLEQTVPWNVRLTAIRPTFKDDAVEITLHGTAQDLDALLDLQNALLHSPYFRDVIPGGYERDEVDQRYSFRVTTLYTPEPAPQPDAGVEGDAPVAEPAPVGPEGTDRAAPATGAAGPPGRGIAR